MTESAPLLGPRGWAVLVLAGGATLSAPFLRNSGSLPDKPNTTGSPHLHVDSSSSSWPDLSEDILTPPSQFATDLSEQDWAELAQLRNHSGAAPRKVSGNLPSTSGLPIWADHGQPVQHLVNESIRTEPLSPVAPVASTTLEPLRPWTGGGMKTNSEAWAKAPQTGDLKDSLAVTLPNPDRRWSNIPSTTNSTASPKDTSPKHNGVLADNKPFRRFEDHVQQWPDEKLSPIQIAGQLANQAAHAQTNWPDVSQAPGFSMAGKSSGSTLPSVSTDQSPKPDSVSAPMVSSQSVRPAPAQAPAQAPDQAPDQAPEPSPDPSPGLTPRTVESLKPPTDSPRTKHFIQQPAKRA